MDIDELVMAALHLEKSGRELVAVAEKLYDEAIVLAIEARVGKEPIEFRAVPVPANLEEEIDG